MQEGPNKTELTQNYTNLQSKDNVFLLKKITEQPSKVSVQVNFTPQQLNSSSNHNSQLISIKPTLNKDSKYYTPCFMLETDMLKLNQNDQCYFTQHNRKKQELSQQKAQLFVPQPSKMNRFCCICREPYEDYLTHVNIPSHQRLLRGSEYSESIMELCERVNPSKKIMVDEDVCQKNKRIQKKTKRGQRVKKDKKNHQTSITVATLNSSNVSLTVS